jgi:hypothetical protein
MAMICTYAGQASNLVVTTYANGKIGKLQTVISNQMVAQPTWAPDGSGIAYLAPAIVAEPFQLWFVPAAQFFPPKPSPSPSASAVATASPPASPSPAPSPSPVVIKPIQITQYDGFDATSPLAWASN